VLVSFAALAMVGLLLLHRYSMPPDAYLDTRSDMYEVQSLLELIRVQNETIQTLETHLVQRMHQGAMPGMGISKEDTQLVRISNEISRLSRENEMHRQKAASCNSSLQPVAAQQKCSALGARGPATREPLAGFEADCEARYGLELAETWRHNEQTWCVSRPGDAVQSELKCYPYHQKHKKLDGRGADLFCEATNFVIDFSKVNTPTPLHPYTPTPLHLLSLTHTRTRRLIPTVLLFLRETTLPLSLLSLSSPPSLSVSLLSSKARSWTTVSRPRGRATCALETDLCCPPASARSTTSLGSSCPTTRCRCAHLSQERRCLQARRWWRHPRTCWRATKTARIPSIAPQTS
jgi:hypothetical protein